MHVLDLEWASSAPCLPLCLPPLSQISHYCWTCKCVCYKSIRHGARQQVLMMSTRRHAQGLCIRRAWHHINIFMTHTRAVRLQSPQQCQTRHRWYHQQPTSQGLCRGSRMPSPYQLARPTVQPTVASPWLMTHPLTVLTTHIHIHAHVAVHRCEHVLDVQPCRNTTHIYPWAPARASTCRSDPGSPPQRQATFWCSLSAVCHSFPCLASWQS